MEVGWGEDHGDVEIAVGEARVLGHPLVRACPHPHPRFLPPLCRLLRGQGFRPLRLLPRRPLRLLRQAPRRRTLLLHRQVIKDALLNGAAVLGILAKATMKEADRRSSTWPRLGSSLMDDGGSSGIWLLIRLISGMVQ